MQEELREVPIKSEPSDGSGAAVARERLERGIIKMEFHPLAELFPMMSAEAFAEFCPDIAANGLREDIWTAPDLDDGGTVKIIDGRNRFNACIKTGIEPRFRSWSGEGSLTDFVVSLNLKRRHLSESQRAMVAQKLATWVGEGTQICVPSSQSIAAEILNVSQRLVSSAAKVARDGVTELAELVESGEMPVSYAAMLSKLSKKKQKDHIRRGRKAGKGLIRKRIAESLKHTAKGFIGCLHCNPDAKWSDESISAFTQKLAHRAAANNPRYAAVFANISEEIEEVKLADAVAEHREKILLAIDKGVTIGGDTGIRERLDLQRVTRIPWQEFNATITYMLDYREIEAVQQGGKTEVARGATKTLFKRAAKSETADPKHDTDDDFAEPDVYLDRWSDL